MPAPPVPILLAVDTIPLRDPTVLYNLALIELQEAARAASTPVERTAVQINLAIVHLRLRNWDQAISALERRVAVRRRRRRRVPCSISPDSPMRAR